ncbi:IS200/IS605 family transposase [Microscilla marina]|uniref:IS200/IS605 family transposase n=1 Tax=Microscilla marina TaxID=1027 RepID=UPI0005D46EED|nr:IS200/IS605 family transposase [Microscilla marina]
MECTTENHSKLIFVCKYRKHLLIKVGGYIKSVFHSIALKYKLEIVEMEVDKDHIHLLIRHSPTKSILEIVRLFKQISTFGIWRSDHSDLLSKHFWKEKTFWSDGYFAYSIGNVSKENIAKYIQQKG